mmetsp:Transcript_5032/g.12074  ORF Transcript_5032/g.12074 Transcript_5032/m.12074 type:complete len:155 (-) Transcript_5032:125-589(-)
MAEVLTMRVMCPENVGPGMAIVVETHDGQHLQVEVPGDVGPGQPFFIQYYAISAEGKQALDDAVQNHPDDDFVGVQAYGEPVSSGMGDYEPRDYFTFQPPSYYVGQYMKVLRSDESYSDCVICRVHLTALGPRYDVDVGGGQMKVGVEEGDLVA